MCIERGSGFVYNVHVSLEVLSPRDAELHNRQKPSFGAQPSQSWLHLL